MQYKTKAAEEAYKEIITGRSETVSKTHQGTKATAGVLFVFNTPDFLDDEVHPCTEGIGLHPWAQGSQLTCPGVHKRSIPWPGGQKSKIHEDCPIQKNSDLTLGKDDFAP